MNHFISQTRWILLVAMAGLACCPTSSSATALPVNDLPVQMALPDTLVMDNGQSVTTPAQWAARREEMKRILEDYEFGHAPSSPGNVRGREIESMLLLGGQVSFRRVHLTFGPGEKLGFDLDIFSPVQTNPAPLPTIIHLDYHMEDVTKHGIGADLLGKLDTLIVSDILPNATTAAAHYLLPGCAHAEKRGTFTNAKGRVQKFMKAVEPPGDARPEWEFLHELVFNVTGQNGFVTIEGLFNQMAKEVPAFNGLTWAALGDTGVTVNI
jgi:hypothetical protein